MNRKSLCFDKNTGACCVKNRKIEKHLITAGLVPHAFAEDTEAMLQNAGWARWLRRGRISWHVNCPHQIATSRFLKRANNNSPNDRHVDSLRSILHSVPLVCALTLFELFLEANCVFLVFLVDGCFPTSIAIGFDHEECHIIRYRIFTGRIALAGFLGEDVLAHVHFTGLVVLGFGVGGP